MHNILPKKYYYIDKFDLEKIKNTSRDTCIIYRNYSENYKTSEIKKLKYFCKIRGIKFLISNNFKLALKLDLDGAYIPSFCKDFRHLNYKIKKKFIIVGSAHNLKEIRLKEKQNVDCVVLSSIFKKNKNFLGINRFRNLSKLTKKKIIALGGISKKNEKYLGLVNSYGFSGISFFSKKKGPN